jgi:hypothetical protein
LLFAFLMGCSSQRTVFYAVPQDRTRVVTVTDVALDSSALDGRHLPVLVEGQAPRSHRLAKPKRKYHRHKNTIPAMHSPTPSQPAEHITTRATEASSSPANENRPLNGVLLLVPVLALLALAGVSLAVAGIFSIGFWAAFGWTTLVVVGGLLLALGIAILRGK